VGNATPSKGTNVLSKNGLKYSLASTTKAAKRNTKPKSTGITVFHWNSVLDPRGEVPSNLRPKFWSCQLFDCLLLLSLRFLILVSIIGSQSRTAYSTRNTCTLQ